MSQFNWTLLDDAGHRFDIGLFHGNRTGHLIVFCNKKIVVIDFNVLETKTYTFFVEDELCNLEVELKDNKWHYGLKIDEKTATPLNILRKKERKKNLVTSIIILSFIILLISTISLLLTILSN